MYHIFIPNLEKQELYINNYKDTSIITHAIFIIPHTYTMFFVPVYNAKTPTTTTTTTTIIYLLLINYV